MSAFVSSWFLIRIRIVFSFRAIAYWCRGGLIAIEGPPVLFQNPTYRLSIKSECLDRMVMLGERHLRRAIASYVEQITWSGATKVSVTG